MQVGTHDPVPCLGPWPAGKPALSIPGGAWDCHAHVIGAGPWVSPRNYDPQVCTVEDYLVLLDQLGFAYGVLVQVSVHGTDNSLILDALRRHPDRLRGVVAVSPSVTDAELAKMAAAGVCGVRLLALTRGGVSPDAAIELVERIAPFGWHIELGVPGHALAEFRAMIDALPVPVVLAHFGDCDMTTGIAGEQFAALQAVLDRPQRHVKLSAAYRLCAGPWTTSVPVAHALLASHPHALLWGSDWPHVAINDSQALPRTEALVDLLGEWSPGELALKTILVDNPASLYGLPSTNTTKPENIKEAFDAHARTE